MGKVRLARELLKITEEEMDKLSYKLDVAKEREERAGQALIWAEQARKNAQGRYDDLDQRAKTLKKILPDLRK